MSVWVNDLFQILGYKLGPQRIFIFNLSYKIDGEVYNIFMHTPNPNNFSLFPYIRYKRNNRLCCDLGLCVRVGLWWVKQSNDQDFSTWCIFLYIGGGGGVWTLLTPWHQMQDYPAFVLVAWYTSNVTYFVCFCTNNTISFSGLPPSILDKQTRPFDEDLMDIRNHPIQKPTRIRETF